MLVDAHGALSFIGNSLKSYQVKLLDLTYKRVSLYWYQVGHMALCRNKDQPKIVNVGAIYVVVYSTVHLLRVSVLGYTQNISYSRCVAFRGWKPSSVLKTLDAAG